MKEKRIRVIIGHYGSGKTEIAVNMAMNLAKAGKQVAIADLDIVNPYFRSRERASLMEEQGIRVISSTLGHSLSLDLPAVSSEIVGPIQDERYDVIMDVGGNNVGAKVLARFKTDLLKHDHEVFFVLNANRPETASVKGAIGHLKDIEYETGLKVTGIINNTHLLRETTEEELQKGEDVAKEVSQALDIPIVYTAVIHTLVPSLKGQYAGEILPVQMYMRDDWM